MRQAIPLGFEALNPSEDRKTWDCASGGGLPAPICDEFVVMKTKVENIRRPTKNDLFKFAYNCSTEGSLTIQTRFAEKSSEFVGNLQTLRLMKRNY